MCFFFSFFLFFFKYKKHKDKNKRLYEMGTSFEMRQENPRVEEGEEGW